MNMKQLREKYADELKILEPVPMPKACFWPAPAVRNSIITQRENYLRILRREKPMFMAIDLDEYMLSPAIFPDAVARGFVVDMDGMPESGPGGKDMFGIEWEYVEQVGGSMVRPGAPAVEDIHKWEEAIVFPDIEQWDWEGSAKRNAPLHTSAFATNVWIMNGIFERLISFMDFENAAVALVDEEQQPSVHRLFDKLSDLYVDIVRHIKKYFQPDVIYFHDDWGSQRAPFFSLSTCREMIVPYLKKVIDAVHQEGMIFNFHSCGKNEPLVPAMIEAGVDTWCGQPMNDFKMLYEQYGEQIALGIYTVPPAKDATEEEVVKAVQDFLDTYTCKGVAYPVIYADEYSDAYLDILYMLSRERFSQ